jgi:hypothetical protein
MCPTREGSGLVYGRRLLVLTAIEHEQTASDPSPARHVALEFIRCTIFAGWYRLLQAIIVDARLRWRNTIISFEVRFLRKKSPVGLPLEQCYIDCTGLLDSMRL